MAKKITEAAEALGHQVDLIITGDNDDSFEILDYDMIFAGSGVYSCKPSESMSRFLAAAGKRGMKTGAIKPSSPRLPGKFAVVYCTYGGVHTGINEAVPCIKSIGQLFDHYGFEVLEEWYTVGAFMPKNMHRAGRRIGAGSRRRPSYFHKTVRSRDVTPYHCNFSKVGGSVDWR